MLQSPYQLGALVVLDEEADRENCLRALESSEKILASENVTLAFTRFIDSSEEDDKTNSIRDLAADVRWQGWVKLWETEKRDEDFMIACLPEDSSLLGLVDAQQGLASTRYPIAWFQESSRDSLTTKIVLHEIGHLLGATHSMFGFMSPVSEMLHFASGYSTKSRQEMRTALSAGSNRGEIGALAFKSHVSAIKR